MCEEFHNERLKLEAPNTPMHAPSHFTHIEIKEIELILISNRTPTEGETSLQHII